MKAKKYLKRIVEIGTLADLGPVPNIPLGLVDRRTGRNFTLRRPRYSTLMVDATQAEEMAKKLKGAKIGSVEVSTGQIDSTFRMKTDKGTFVLTGMIYEVP